MAEETSFYSDQSGVRVTDKRVILGSTTYSLANITSVTTGVETPSRVGPILCIAIGAVLLVSGLTQKQSWMAITGIILGAFGYIWNRGCNPVWHLRIASASGESTPLKSTNQQWITSIAHAINEAIIHRT